MSDILLTVRDVAAILQSGEDAVIRRFAKMDGVIDLGSQSESKRLKSCSAWSSALSCFTNPEIRC